MSIGTVAKHHLVQYMVGDALMALKKFNLTNFHHIRPFFTSQADKTYMHAMIVSNIFSFLTTWSHTAANLLKTHQASLQQKTTF